MRKLLAGLLAGLLFFAPFAPAQAAIGTPYGVSYVGNNANGVTVVRTLAGAEAYQIDDYVVAQFGWFKATGNIVGVVDSKLNVWTCAAQVQRAGSSQTLSICYSKLTAALVAGDTITGTVDTASTNNRFLLMTAFSGGGTVDKFTISGQATTTGVNSSGIVSSGTLASAYEIVFATAMATSNMTAVPAGFTSVTTYPTGIDLIYRITSSTASLTPAWAGANANWVMQMMSVRDASPPAPAGGALTLGCC